MADDQREEFASRIETLLSELNPGEYRSLKAQVKWSEMEPTTPPKKKDETPRKTSKNVQAETINTFHGPVEINGNSFQNIIDQSIYLQQVPINGYYYPQQLSSNDYQQPQQPKQKKAPQAPQVEALMERLNRSK